MKKAHRLLVLLAMLSLPLAALAATIQAPAEVMASAPNGTHLLAFSKSGDQADADAAAVFETPPDKEGVRYRTLVFFHKQDGRFVPDLASDRLIACSKCSQFHDDPFESEQLEVTPGHVSVVQMDGGGKPSTTTLKFARQADQWSVTSASRRSVVMGVYDERTENLAIPASRLAKDMDVPWDVPIFLNTLLLNQQTNQFSFIHGHPSIEAMWESQKADCDPQRCIVLAQQQDGCISLVRDRADRSFAGTSLQLRTQGRQEALAAAMSACKRAHGEMCHEIDTHCSRGIL